MPHFFLITHGNILIYVRVLQLLNRLGTNADPGALLHGKAAHDRPGFTGNLETASQLCPFIALYIPSASHPLDYLSSSSDNTTMALFPFKSSNKVSLWRA